MDRPMNSPEAPSPILPEEYQRLRAEVERLTLAQEQLEERRRLDSHIARFADLLRWHSELTLETWADRVLTELTRFVGGLQASLYMTEHDAEDGRRTLVWIGGYAMSDTVARRIPFGEGLNGQVAKDGKPIYLENIQHAAGQVASTLTYFTPRAIFIQPLLYNQQMEGVLELSSMAPFTTAEKEFLAALCDSLAANLSSIRNQVRIQALYREAQEKSEMLQAQEEEMRQNVEELQSTQDEMKRVQQALGEYKVFMENMVNSANILFIATDMDGIVRYWNRAATRALGYSRAEAIDKITPALFHDPEEVAAEARRLSQEYGVTVQPGMEVFGFLPYRGEVYEREWTYIAKDGRRFPVLLSVTAWRKADGEFGGQLGIATDITQKRKAEELIRKNAEELERQKASFASLVDNIPGVVFRCYVDNHWSMEYISPKVEELTGYPQSGFHNKEVNLGELILPEDNDTVSRAVSQAIVKNQQYEVEYRLRRADEQVVWVYERAAPKRNDRGEVQLEGVILDITERKAAEAQLKESEATLREAQTVARIASWEYDFVQQVFRFNDAFFFLLGITDAKPEDYVVDAETFLSTVPLPEDRHLMQAKMRAAMKAPDASYHDFVSFRAMDRQTGDVIFLDAQIRIRKGDDGRTLSTFGTIQDVTLQQRQEDAIEEQLAANQRLTDFLNTVINNLPVGLFIKDAETLQFVEWNQTAADIFGIPKDEVVGKTAFQIFNEAQAERRTEDDFQVISAQKVVVVPEEEHINNRGERILLKTTKLPILGADGAVTHILGITEDITQQKLHQMQLAEREELFRLMADVNPAGIVLTRLSDNIILFVNDAAAWFFNAESAAELLGQPAGYVYKYDADKEAFRAQLRDTGVVKGFELEAGLPNKSVEWVSLSGAITRYKDAEVSMAVVFDITQAKRREAALLEANEKVTNMKREEAERAKELAANQTRIMEKMMAKYQSRERDLQEKIKNLEAELAQLRQQLGNG